MDSISSTFLAKFPKNLMTPTTPRAGAAPSLSPPLPTIHAVRIQDRKQTAVTKPAPSPPPPPQSTRKQPRRPAADPPSLPSTILNAVDHFIDTFIDPPLKPSFDPRYILADNFAPVDEMPPTECRVVKGSLPEDLDGAYIRNGPNPQFLPRGPYHLFDGDGMLHALTISKGKATLCSRYVRTYRYEIERERGFSVFPNFFSGFGGISAMAARGAVVAARVLAGEFDLGNGTGLANTSLAMFGGRLYALGESDLPYSVKIDTDGEIHTVGRHDFAGKLAMSMTAHPKTDAQTGETFAFRYGPMPPYLTFFRIDSDGEKQPDVPIFSMSSPSFLHDFAITKKYAVFNENQIVMNPVEMVTGGSPVGADTGKVSRIGVIPRYATDESEMRWFEVAGLNLIHSINAWDEDDGDTIVLVGPNILSIEHTLERMELVHASIEMVKIDMRRNTVARHTISARNLDFGVFNPAFVGRKHRYIYAAIGDPMPKISGVVKLDLSISEDARCDCVVASRLYGQGCFGGEPFFVSRQPENPESEEDDGYVVTYTHNENTGESRFLVMDAKSPNLEIVAAVRLPRRVPYGFHGMFVRQRDLRKL